MRLLAAPLLLLASVPASAQRAAENAVLEAEDAFGTSIGRETIGLYSSSSVRGFSPTRAGNLAANFNVVAGAVLLDARVTGDGVTLGRVGERPVGQTDTTLQLNADWQVPAATGLSFDIGVQHEGDIVATVDNRVSIPARTLVDLGARYRTKIGGKPVTFRLTMTSVGDVQGFDLRGAGAYDIIPGRVIGGWIAVDL